MVQLTLSPFIIAKKTKDTEALVSNQDPEVAVHKNDSSTGRSLLTLLGLAFILAGLIVGGACIYRYFLPKKMYHGEMHYTEQGYEFQDSDLKQPLALPVVEEADIRLEENVAILKIPAVPTPVPVPNFDDSDPAIILHDFERHLTVYLDLQLDNCYVIPLNTSVVMRPRNLMDLFIKLASGAYLPQSYLVHEEMVVTEEIDDVFELGVFINQLCGRRKTYKLQRRDQIIGLQKRSVEKCVKIRHFENVYVTETKICTP
ncbi:integral membrane protein 2A [Protopterus annectens]|uniref:integral membrane protein 2A n=1 Tax=Protopterus annectens TaxID=7888 RepID=UPI001CFC0DB2|nr:integral membrane protein 2A [Protopterus annectens]